MARKLQQRPVEAKTVVTQQYKIQAKFNEYVLCPRNAIEPGFYTRNPAILPELVTADGSVCEAEFISTWNDTGGVYDDEFDNICQCRFGVPFVSIRSIWIGRLGRIDDFWHLIKLKRK